MSLDKFGDLFYSQDELFVVLSSLLSSKSTMALMEKPNTTLTSSSSSSPETFWRFVLLVFLTIVGSLASEFLGWTWNTNIGIPTVSAQIRGRRLIKKLGFYGEILLNKTLNNWQILLNKELKWRFNQEWPLICADTVVDTVDTISKFLTVLKCVC